jgi:hypothetical protein
MSCFLLAGEILMTATLLFHTARRILQRLLHQSKRASRRSWKTPSSPPRCHLQWGLREMLPPCRMEALLQLRQRCQ